MISDTLTVSNFVGMRGTGANHVQVSNCILDFNHSAGIKLEDSGPAFSANWCISNCYIAMGGVAGSAAIWNVNSVSNSANRGTKITNCEIIVYSSASCPYGFYGEGSEAKNNIITNNVFKGFSQNDIRAVQGESIATANYCLSSVTNNISVIGVVADNIGTVQYIPYSTYSYGGGRKAMRGSAPPSTGTYRSGDIVYSNSPDVSNAVGWICVAGGNPGTWSKWGNIGL
jgi:hypothetical protein